MYEQLKAMRDRNVSLRVTAGGDVTFEEGSGTFSRDAQRSEEPPPRSAIASRLNDSGAWVVAQDQFTPAIVGGKSNNLNGLRGRLPDWIHLPASLALPFGSMEKLLADAPNQAIRTEVELLVASAEQNPAEALSRRAGAAVADDSARGIAGVSAGSLAARGSAVCALGPGVVAPSSASGRRSGTTGRTSRAAPAAFPTTACKWPCSSSRWSRPITPT